MFAMTVLMTNYGTEIRRETEWIGLTTEQDIPQNVVP